MNSIGTGMGKEVIVQPPPPKDVRNKSLLCKPFTQTKATSCRPHTQTKETQTGTYDIMLFCANSITIILLSLRNPYQSAHSAW